MNKDTITSKKAIVAAVAALVLVGGGAFVLGTQADRAPLDLSSASQEGPTIRAGDDDDDHDRDERIADSADRSRAERAAAAAVPGRIVDVERSDDRVGGKAAAYEVEVIEETGVEWDVWLDTEFGVIDKQRDD